MTSVFFALLVSIGAQAYTVNIQHSGPVELEHITVAQINGADRLTSGRLKQDTKVNFARGNSLNLSQGTRLGFYPTVTENLELRVSDVVIIDRIEPTDWIFTNDLTLNIDCSKPAGAGASFVFFNPDGHLSDGCSLTRTVEFIEDNKHIVLSAGSKFKLGIEGELLYGQLVSEGRVNINNQEVLLAEENSVAFHPNGNPHFLHLKAGETFTADTVYGEMLFGHRADQDVIFPSVFYENGKVESAWHIGEKIDFEFAALGTIVSQSINTNAPVRLNNLGEVLQILLTNDQTLTSQTNTRIVRREIQYGINQSLDLGVGDTFTLPAGAQLIFEDQSLTGFTHAEASGLAFVYTINEGLSLLSSAVEEALTQ
jgi:hypothetical protein